MFFVATQSVKIAFFLWAIYFAFSRILLNENHKFNLLPRSWVQSEHDEHGLHGIGRPAKPTDLYYENLKQLPQ